MNRSIYADYTFRVPSDCAPIPDEIKNSLTSGPINTTYYCSGSQSPGTENLDDGSIQHSTEPLNFWGLQLNASNNTVRKNTSNRSIAPPVDKDFVKTTANMGERKKRPFDWSGNEVLCPNNPSDSFIGWIAQGDEFIGGAIMSDPTWAFDCEDHIDSESKCIKYGPEDPAGWINVSQDAIVNSEKSFHTISQGGIQDWNGCQYSYVKDWDTNIVDDLSQQNPNLDYHYRDSYSSSGDILFNVPGTYWGAPKYWGGLQNANHTRLNNMIQNANAIKGYTNKIFAQNESPLAQTSGNNMMLSYNKNKIPITRMSCCLNKEIRARKYSRFEPTFYCYWFRRRRIREFRERYYSEW